MYRLLRHEAEVHAIPGRDLRDLGDALLLLDPSEPEPFWNRLEAINWPEEPAAFDRRLAETAVMFAAAGRQPHCWPSPAQDTPADLVDRLRTNGFEAIGDGFLMVTRDPAPVQAALRAGPPADTIVERVPALHGRLAERTAGEIVDVLLAAFGVVADRPNLQREVVAALADARISYYVARLEGLPVAVARRATFDGLSYLSSIGTMEQVRGQGLGGLLTATAALDGLDAGSEWVHLGVFSDNLPAVRLYRRLGFVESGLPGPDMLLTG